jgi:RND family efflux transporter MFP subunit
MNFNTHIYIVCLSVLLAACHHSPNHSEREHEGRHHAHHNGHDDAPDEHAPDEIVLTGEQAATFGVQVTEVHPGAFNMVIKTGGQIQAAQGDEQTIAAPASGIVSFAKSLAEGSPVAKELVLLRISAQHIAEGDPVAKSKLAFERAGREFRRAGSLIIDSLISQSEFEQAQLNYLTAKIAHDALSQRQTGTGIAVAATIGGYIKRRWVNEGEYVAIGQPLLTISQNRRLCLKADVPERYFAQLPLIMGANFKTPYDPSIHQLTDLKGRLLSYGKSADASNYIPVLFEFDNIGAFRPGAYVEVFLLTSRCDNVLTLPLNAVIEEQGLYFVFKQVQDDSYKKQEVQIGDDNGTAICIVSGLQAGDRVVTQGALHVKLAGNTASIPEHIHAH